MKIDLFYVLILLMCVSLAKGFLTSARTSCKCTRHPRSFIPRPLNVAALVWKNLTHIYRNPALLLFQFFIPTFQIILFILAIGGDLKGVNVAYTTDDTDFPGINLSTLCNATDGLANYSNFGDLYVSKLKLDNTFDLVSIRSHHYG